MKFVKAASLRNIAENVYDHSSLIIEQLASGSATVGVTGSKMQTGMQEHAVCTLIEKGSVSTPRAAALAALISAYG